MPCLREEASLLAEWDLIVHCEAIAKKGSTLVWAQRLMSVEERTVKHLEGKHVAKWAGAQPGHAGRRAGARVSVRACSDALRKGHQTRDNAPLLVCGSPCSSHTRQFDKCAARTAGVCFSTLRRVGFIKTCTFDDGGFLIFCCSTREIGVAALMCTTTTARVRKLRAFSRVACASSATAKADDGVSLGRAPPSASENTTTGVPELPAPRDVANGAGPQTSTSADFIGGFFFVAITNSCSYSIDLRFAHPHASTSTMW